MKIKTAGMSEQVELVPCRKCGCKAIARIQAWNCFAVECGACETETDAYVTQEQADEAWNEGEGQ